MFSETVLSIYGPRSVWFEGNLCLISTIAAGHIGHFSWALAHSWALDHSWALVDAITSVSISHVFHLPFVSIKNNRYLPQKHLKRRLSESMLRCGLLRQATYSIYLSVKKND
jgi:hypothetical protein